MAISLCKLLLRCRGRVIGMSFRQAVGPARRVLMGLVRVVSCDIGPRVGSSEGRWPGSTAGARGDRLGRAVRSAGRDRAPVRAATTRQPFRIFRPWPVMCCAAANFVPHLRLVPRSPPLPDGSAGPEVTTCAHAAASDAGIATSSRRPSGNRHPRFRTSPIDVKDSYRHAYYLDAAGPSKHHSRPGSI